MELPQIIDKISTDANQFIGSLKGFVVTNPDNQLICIDALSKIKARLKRIDELRKEFVTPLNDQVKKINNMFKAQSEPLEAFEVQLKATLKTYMDEQDRLARIEAEKLRQEQAAKEAAERKAAEEAAKKQAEAERLAREAEQAKNAAEKAKLQELAEKAAAENKIAQEAASVAKIEASQEVAILAPSKSVRSDDGMASRKLVWKFEVENIGLTMRAHPELFELNQKAVNQLIQSGERNIAGLRVFQDSIIAIK